MTTTLSSPPRYERGARLTPEEEAEFRAWALKMYDANWSIRRIVERSGRSYGAVHKSLSEAGVTFRSRGGAQKRPSSAEDGAA